MHPRRLLQLNKIKDRHLFSSVFKLLCFNGQKHFSLNFVLSKAKSSAMLLSWHLLRSSKRSCTYYSLKKKSFVDIQDLVSRFSRHKMIAVFLISTPLSILEHLTEILRYVKPKNKRNIQCSRAKR